MQWALYLLAKHPEAQEKAAKDPNYIKWILKETSRLYPIAPFITRVLPEDSEIAGYNIPAGVGLVHNNLNFI
jgi:cytochrome P450